MNTKFHYLLISFLLWTSDSFAQVIESGKIVNGFIEYVCIDSTEQALKELSKYEKILNIYPTQEIYFNKEYKIVKTKYSEPAYELLTYDEHATGLIYMFYKKGKEKYYTIDSSFILSSEVELDDEMNDSTEYKSAIQLYLQAQKISYLGLECRIMEKPGTKRNEPGYQKLFLTQDLGIQEKKGDSSAKTIGFPAKNHVYITQNIEAVYGIKEWKPIKPNNKIFKMPVKKYIKISMDECLSKIYDYSITQ
jgi:hypothetical protein